MKISFNWLKSYLDTSLSAEEAAEILTDTGLEVEKVERIGTAEEGLREVVVGHVLSVTPHPNADRLRLTQVDIGNAVTLPIVCGAPNVEAGQKVLVAKVGAVLLPESEAPLKIKKAKIRGEVSEGMICAEDELGIGESHEGIMVLPADAPLGAPAAEYLQLKEDHVFEIGLTPNRTDGFSHFGVARDLAARLSHDLKTDMRAKLPVVHTMQVSPGDESGKIAVEVLDEDGCGRYAGQQIDRVKVGPSPEWLQTRLRAIGLNPINNVVDITNFVMHETGQPLHAFDADKIAGNKITVRTMAAGTTFVTLDGVERNLSADDLMICNQREGMCMAGVFGGLSSGVTENTTRIFIESAWFNPVRIRKAAKQHGLNTDSSFRFERGVDPNGTIYALMRAVELVCTCCEGQPAYEMVDVITYLPEPVDLKFSLMRCNSLCGTSITPEEIEPIFKSLDIEIRDKKLDIYTLRIPQYRADVTREVDVVEEVLRIYGYNNVPLPERMTISVSIPEKPAREEVIHSLGNMLAGRGFMEAMSNGLTRSDRILAAEGEKIENQLVYILNPLSQELDVLRPHVTDSMLTSTVYNLNRQSERLMLFEYGTAYRRKDKTHFNETLELCLLLQGNRFEENWNNPERAFDFSDLRGHLRAVSDAMGLTAKMDSRRGEDMRFDEGQVITLLGKPVGNMGRLSKGVMKAYGLKKQAWIIELNMDACLEEMTHGAVQQRELPKYPAVRRDFSLLLDDEITFDSIRNEAVLTAGKLLKEVGLFDVYEGENLPQGKKSYAVKFIFQHEERTLQDNDVDQKMDAIRLALEQKLGAQLR